MRKRDVFRKIVTLMLVMALALTAVPVVCAEDEEMPTAEEIMDMMPKGVTKPKNSSLLDEPKEMQVETENGKGTSIRKGTNRISRTSGKAEEGSIVTVYAIQNGFALGVIKESNQGGWIDMDFLTSAVEESQSSDTASVLGNFEIEGSGNECGLPFTPNDFFASGAYDAIEDKLNKVLNRFGFTPLSYACYQGNGAGSFSFSNGSVYYWMEDCSFMQFSIFENNVKTSCYFDYDDEGGIEGLTAYYDDSPYYDMPVNCTKISFLSDENGITGIESTGYGGDQKVSNPDKELEVQKECGGYSVSFKDSVISVELGSFVRFSMIYEDGSIHFDSLEITDNDDGVIYGANYDDYLESIFPSLTFPVMINGNLCYPSYHLATMEYLSFRYDYTDDDGREAYMGYTIVPWNGTDDCITAAYVKYYDSSEDFFEFDEDGNLY